jgi:hypothetical protein
VDFRDGGGFSSPGKENSHVTTDGELTLFDDVPGMGNPEMGMTDPGCMAGTVNPETGTSPPARMAGTENPATGMTLPAHAPSCQPGHPTSRNGQLLSRNGQVSPRDGQTVPQAAGAGKPYAFDWSVGRGVTAVDPDGFTWHTDTLEKLFRDLPRGVTVVGESTFESYDLRQREHVMQIAESRDITFLTVPARGNPRRRAAAGLPPKTRQSRQTDREDALAIQHAAISGAHLKKPAPVDKAWAELREGAAKRFIYLRYSGQKDQYATGLLRHLPVYALEPIGRRIALGRLTDGHLENWNLIIVAAVGVAAEFVSTRPDFERLTGLYAHGYPSQFRSDLMYWGWGKQPRKQERITLSVYRRELRWLFNQLAGNNDAC